MIRINLLRPESKEVKERGISAEPEVKERKPAQLGGVFILLVIVGLVIAFFLQRRTLQKENDLLQAAQQEKTQLQYVISALDQLNVQKTNFERKISLINQLKARQGIAVIVMDELSKNLPDWVWLTDVSYDNAVVSLKGNALSNNLIADFTRDLENSPAFNNVNLISSTQKTIVGAEQVMEFSLNMEYVLPPEAQPPVKVQAKPAKRGKQ